MSSVARSIMQQIANSCKFYKSIYMRILDIALFPQTNADYFIYNSFLPFLNVSEKKYKARLHILYFSSKLIVCFGYHWFLVSYKSMWVLTNCLVSRWGFST